MLGSVITASTDSYAYRQQRAEVWHLQRLGNGQPLCGARLAGKVRTAERGRVTCDDCMSRDLPRLYGNAPDLLLDIARGVQYNATTYKKHYQIQALEDADLAQIKHPQGIYVITERGKIVAEELKRPAPWRDNTLKLIHGRNGLSSLTKCGLSVGIQSLADLISLTKNAKHKKLRTPTCITCAAKP